MVNCVSLAVIGGSGVYNIEGARVLDRRQIKTPFGDPSDEVTIVDFDGTQVAFLPRHGRGHRVTPTEIPVRANLWALKSLGVKSLIAISAVGSLQEEYAPGDWVLPNQVIDRTKGRVQTFFGDGIVGHVGFADPFCNDLSAIVEANLRESGVAKIHTGATYLCMEGPAFSTRAESHLYRSWGCGIIGMTAIPEAKLAREAEIAYALIGMVTDYDCWREEEEAVTVDAVMAVMKKNSEGIKRVLPRVLQSIPKDFSSPAHEAARFAIISALDELKPEVRQRLELFYGKYWGKSGNPEKGGGHA